MLLKTYLIALLLLIGLPVVASAQDGLEALLGDGGMLLHDSGGNIVASHNPDRILVPASIVKIPLSQVALNVLGEDFRFETHFFINAERDLLIRGLGDPFLVSEDIAEIADTLSRLGLENVSRLVMDDSAFEKNPELPLELNARDPYAARVSALSTNFNTVNLAWDASGKLVSGEEQTPLTALARELAAQLPGRQNERINLGADPEAGLQQAQQLFMAFMERAGIAVADSNFYHEPVDDQWQLFYQHRSSRSLREILAGMLRYSNNFIANQLFLTLGAHENGYPATVTSSLSVLRAELVRLYGEGFGTDASLLLMTEGSGLSREQRTSAKGMMQILESFRPYADLLPEVNGILRKSGTLTGVYNYAGYLQRVDGLYPFVILTNQGANNRDEVLQILSGY
ncbi:MAG: D-alanyl-D-alanine carboxypeptidase [Proteobacteria bacterium]|nr:D-alanyl-D-alanine carboxypeptidase [Pseudomonadota bacterium]MDA0928642.1 D-alanyl-D-alanine carboxypeptidase [Pseudomonadota bacterium]